LRVRHLAEPANAAAAEAHVAQPVAPTTRSSIPSRRVASASRAVERLRETKDGEVEHGDDELEYTPRTE